MKLNFERKERINDYDPQKFMKNPNIEENFENRKFAMAEYRKSVHARSKSQIKPANNNNVNSNTNNNLNKFNQVSNIDETPERKIDNPMAQKDAFFFEDDNAVNDFNKIDNNFSNFNKKGKDVSNGNNRNKSNIKPKIPMSRLEPNHDKNVAFTNNGFNNSFNHNSGGINNNINNKSNNLGSGNNYNNSLNTGMFNFTSCSNNISNSNNMGNNPVKIQRDLIGNNDAGKKDDVKAIDDFNEIFGNPNLNINEESNNNINLINNNNQSNFGNKMINFNDNNNFMQNRGAGNVYGYNNEANVVLETQNDFGKNHNINAFNIHGNNNIGANDFNPTYNQNKFDNFDFSQNNSNQIGYNYIKINNNQQQANPGINNIGRCKFF
jgi:hypothetical protein